MAPYIYVEDAHRSYGPVDKQALAGRLPRAERGILRMGLVKPEQWRQMPTEGIYQLAITEVLDTGATVPLDRAGGRAFAVASVLDLGLRMLESERGRQGLVNLARKAICVWRERPTGPVVESWPVDVPVAVDEFLRCVRYRFPVVRLDDRNGFCRDEDNQGLPYAWADEFQTFEHTDYDPKAAAVLHLNWQLVEKLYWTRLKADVARRQQRDEEQQACTARFRRLQFHLAAMVTHHLCHLFVNYLREAADPVLRAAVTDADMLRLVRRYDVGAEFEVDFFGGRPKLFVDQRGPGVSSGVVGRDESYPGQSYVIKRGPRGERVAAVVQMYKIESYLQGDFSVPLLTEVQGAVLPMERYHDLLRRYGGSKQEAAQWHEGKTGGLGSATRGPRRVAAEVGSTDAITFDVPWDVVGRDYQMLKRACYDPTIKVVDRKGV
ncbi:hypothetical protein VTJ49DRAFT_4083 [Mycothermus thermophilus]|uniref:Uncharacterized protein n=1 Tax=Humicola insolens TaxID=85995 RepID=A0ABR3V666_HUMIN